MACTDIKIHSVAACCSNWGIGYKGNLPWRLRKESNHFSKFTSGTPPNGKQNVVIMGRKTWNSLPKSFKPLKNRYNIVMSTTCSSLPGAHAVVSSLDELIRLLTSNEWREKTHEIFNIGGRKIYKLIHDSSYCGKVYLTRIDAKFECDTFFPSMADFVLVNPCEIEETEENGVRWKVEVYEKQNS